MIFALLLCLPSFIVINTFSGTDISLGELNMLNICCSVLIILYTSFVLFHMYMWQLFILTHYVVLCWVQGYHKNFVNNEPLFVHIRGAPSNIKKDKNEIGALFLFMRDRNYECWALHFFCLVFIFGIIAESYAICILLAILFVPYLINYCTVVRFKYWEGRCAEYQLYFHYFYSSIFLSVPCISFVLFHYANIFLLKVLLILLGVFSIYNLLFYLYSTFYWDIVRVEMGLNVGIATTVVGVVPFYFLREFLTSLFSTHILTPYAICLFFCYYIGLVLFFVSPMSKYFWGKNPNSILKDPYHMYRWRWFTFLAGYSSLLIFVIVAHMVLFFL